ncbi:hypothetical protein FisN_1Lh152 [Fistulifera solaris]|uniref:Uncharacterized protein n=1 Tax=Fistulifera solaris TaxID=1519565 RepID=A0A1Z5K502_FISSO|nr:hypothetical protein FisN_1Lh152 [Fistulifera solaris]|eukprot:GAX21317.1 hypothetical protein FisN_1Lh152 [Fistulifera solaris]
MPVVELDTASLDQPLSSSSSETASSDSSVSNDQLNNHLLDDERSTSYSSSGSSYSDHTDCESDEESVGSSKNSFKLLDKIKQTSNKLNMKFLKRGRKKDVTTWKRKSFENEDNIHKQEENTFTTLTETFSSQDQSEIERSNPHFQEPVSFESKNAIDPVYYDVDEQYDDYEWTAVAVPKGFPCIESADTGLNAQIALTSPSASRVTELMAKFGANKSPMISPRANSDYSSDFEEEGSRNVSLLDTDGEHSRFDGSESDVEDEASDFASVISDGTIEDYSDIDALAALAGAVYQISACNYKGLFDGYDDDSIGSEDLNASDKHTRGRSRVPRTPPVELDFIQKSKNFFGFTDSPSKNVKTQEVNKTFLQSMFSSYIHK